ncbi:hypothetical protein L0P39_07130, partial [Bacteroides stercoris]|nr:hypothetical protein [Bacteroides stercoris]
TESLGNNKAPACESRGFVRKIMKVCILTHLLFYRINCYFLEINLYICVNRNGIALTNIIRI